LEEYALNQRLPDPKSKILILGFSQNSAIQETMYLLFQFLVDQVGTLKRMNMVFSTTLKAITATIQL